MTIGGAAAGVVTLVGALVTMVGGPVVTAPMSSIGSGSTAFDDQSLAPTSSSRPSAERPIGEVTTTTTVATAPSQPDRPATTPGGIDDWALVGPWGLLIAPVPLDGVEPALAVPDLLDPSLAPPPEEQVRGVFGLVDGRLQRLADYLVTGDGVVTSADQLTDHRRVALLVEPGRWVEADVVGIDRLTGVGVLEPLDGGLQPDAEAWAEPGTTEIGPGADVRIPSPGPDGEAWLEGTVIGVAQPLVRADGTALYGTLQTTVRWADASAGGPVYDDGTGIIIGLAIETDEYLASAIPIDRVTEVARSFLELGIADPAWLGVVVTPATDGGAVVDEVLPDGPADGAGLAVGDRIVAVEGEIVDGVDHLIYLLRAAGSGSTIGIEILGDDDRASVEVTIGRRPDQQTPGS